MALTWIQRRWRQWLTRRPATVEDLHAFWRKPNWPNRPAAYRDADPGRSYLVRDLLSMHAVKQSGRILELGCNAGRNLAQLKADGCTDLWGIEINPEAARMAQPYGIIKIGPLETILPRLEGSFDAIFTVAVLEHIHPASTDVFYHILRILRPGGVLITIEDELSKTRRHFPRDYRAVFEDILTLKQVYSQGCREVPGLGPNFVARVFRKGK